MAMITVAAETRRASEDLGALLGYEASGHDGEWPHHVVVLVLHNVAMVDIILRSPHILWQLELGSDRGAVTLVRLDGVLEASFVEGGREHGAGREGSGIDPPRDTSRPSVRRFVGLDVERT